MGPCGLRRMYRPICTLILPTISYNICYIMCGRVLSLAAPSPSPHSGTHTPLPRLVLGRDATWCHLTSRSGMHRHTPHARCTAAIFLFLWFVFFLFHFCSRWPLPFFHMYMGTSSCSPLCHVSPGLTPAASLSSRRPVAWLASPPSPLSCRRRVAPGGPPPRSGLLLVRHSLWTCGGYVGGSVS